MNMSTCRHCGEPLDPCEHNAKAAFCNANCKSAYWYRIRYESHALVQQLATASLAERADLIQQAKRLAAGQYL